MKQSQMHTLQELTAAIQDADSATMGQIQSEETGIRTKLTELNREHRKALSSAAQNTIALRQTGSDIAWQIWVGQRRKALQIQLAQVLAKKGVARQTLQTSFGRRATLEEIVRKRRSDTAKKEQGKKLDLLTHLALMQISLPKTYGPSSR